jgi:hypothetical protein
LAQFNKPAAVLYMGAALLVADRGNGGPITLLQFQV